MFKNFKPGATTRVAAFLLLASSTLPGVDFGALRPQGYVNDFAGVLDFAAKTQIERYCGVVERQTGAQMSLVILDTLAGEPVEDVANTLFRKWGIGQKGKNEGILLLIVVKDRRSRLEVGYGLEPILPDGFSGSVLRSMRESLRRSDYSSAMLAAANEIGTRIAQAKGVSLTDRIARPAPANDSSDIPWPFIIGGIILLLLFVLSNRGGGRSGGGRGGGGGSWLPWMIMSQMGGGGRGSYGGGGGGGFGGGDSGGGGFGGFGGGDSGGGGASSDW